VDYKFLCSTVGHLMGLPIRIYRNGKLFAYYSSIEFSPDPVMLIQPQLDASMINATFFESHLLFFGSIQSKKRGVSMIIGPAFSVQPVKDQILSLLSEMNVSYDRYEDFKTYLSSIPPYPIEAFLQIICLLNYNLNNAKLSVSDLLLRGNTIMPIPIINASRENEQHEFIHNTYYMEREMLSYITAGSPQSLNKLFIKPPTGRIGKIAHDELRQKKNTFICAATLASRAAISGGVSYDVAFTMSDYYIQKAELLSDFEAITRLNVEMLLTFASKVEEQKFGGSRSRFVIAAIRFIRETLRNKISLNDVALHVGISRSKMCALFKAEIGTTINEFITHEKIIEAKRLLSFTDNSISCISEELNFSSQSYFQSVFKKIVGTTPNQYRVDHANEVEVVYR